ncbi:protein O-linked-mannose beta-1,2-N-acetylglucosaminyltransferase 1-like [Cherax quadricarinatus]|uniref:protein O-linked-mannose beta-1,2-N-acetylglucosaminyltransferase 1-like n=1 Tax=Cherax quadricarinatus TaxID=27406 RepID=UPI00387EA724
MVDALTLQVNVDGKQVLRQHNVTTRVSPTTYATAHRGVHIVCVDPRHGTSTLIAYYRTWQPRATKGLVDTLTSLQPGTLLVLAAPGDWRFFLDEETNNFMEDFLRGWWVRDVCHGEMWAAVATVGGPLWGEAATTLRIYNSSSSSPLWLTVSVPRDQSGRWCGWYNLPELQQRAAFCQKYEGYGAFCQCQHPSSLTPHLAPALLLKEPIPIVIVTSRHQYKVLRQVQQLWTQAGGGNTSILLAVDGYQQEAKDFASVLGLPAVYHDNPAPPGDMVRINEHIKFAIFQAFNFFPSADKIIILEDDLILAPDFISYFHQTAPLLDADETIFCVNAFNYNSFKPTAVDTSRLYREQILPAYGWMVNRRWAREVLPLWPKRSHGVDWDWFLRGLVQHQRDVVTPEVPRTMHDGSGGVHVTGWEQAAYFDRRALNTDPKAKLNVSYLTADSYELFLEKELSRATLLKIREHPCRKEYVPKAKVGSFLVYYHGETEKDHHLSYFTLIGCLGGYEKGRMEHHRLMHTFGYYGNVVYAVACPGSLYCKVKNEDYEEVVYQATGNDTLITQQHMDTIFRQQLAPVLRTRIIPRSPHDEFLMQNYLLIDNPTVFREIH